MQDFIQQAEKNGLTLLKNGDCQFCGAKVKGGVEECLEIFNDKIPMLAFSNEVEHPLKFLSIDAHCLQHPEIHGRWNNHFHLARMTLILTRNVQWDYKKSPLLSNILNSYKKEHQEEIIVSPEIKKRGATTVVDLLNTHSHSECQAMLYKWANEVYESYATQQSKILEVADEFQKNIFN
jgi:Family of unknown function (DUF5946)